MSAMIENAPKLVLGLVVTAILIGSVLIAALGILANGTKGTACVNCQATTKTLLNNTELMIVLAVFMAIVGAAIAAIVIRGKK